MKGFVLSIVSLVLFCHMSAQEMRDYIWLSGNVVADTTSFNGVNLMNFNNGMLNITRQAKGLSFYVTNASICNPSGELLFYTNGCSINNALHELMDNGDNLNPGVAYLSGNCPNGGNSATNGAIILPLPKDSEKFYLLHASHVSGQSGVFSFYIGKLYYSLIDMSMNNGLGSVVKKNQLIIEDTITSDLHAVKHANGEDWWIIIMRRHKNEYYKVYFTDIGVASITEQVIGENPDPWYSGGGQAGFSPDGSKYARYSAGDQLFLFDFDRATGELSNFQHIYVDTTNIPHWGSLSFSPNSRYLYVGSQLKLWQFDTQAPDVQASKTLIAEYDGFKRFGVSTTFYLMELAPDCKIYMIPRNGSDILHVIHNPDQPGFDCNFKQHDLFLPAVNGASIPNFPNYRLGTPYPFCDSTIQLVVSSVQLSPPVQDIRAYPNPATETLTLELPAPLPAGSEWRLYAATGQVVRQVVLAAGQGKYTVSLAGVAPGLYFWKVTSEAGRSVGQGKVVVVK